MALKKYIVDLLQNNPLNGISTYKDVLTLSTGTISRIIKILVLTGQESGWTKISDSGGTSRFQLVKGLVGSSTVVTQSDVITSHYSNTAAGAGSCYLFVASDRSDLVVRETLNLYATVDDFKAYLAAQYGNGTPVTVWYVLATPTTEQITVPTGLSGTVDGYTTQTGTPTPTNPIYPTANTVTMWANYTPSRYNGNAFVTATGQPEQYNGSWS